MFCLREFLSQLSELSEQNVSMYNKSFFIFLSLSLAVDQATSANQRSQAPPPEAVQGLLVVLCGHGFCC